MRALGWFLIGVSALGIASLFVLALLELRRLIRSARAELALPPKPAGVRDVALELLELARGAR